MGEGIVKNMSNDTLESVTKQNNWRTAFSRVPRVDALIGTGLTLLLGLSLYNTVLVNRRVHEIENIANFNGLLENSLRQYGDQNNDGIVTRAERDEFQIKFSKEYGLTFVSGLNYTYSDGNVVPPEELVRILGEYIGKISKQ